MFVAIAGHGPDLLWYGAFGLAASIILELADPQPYKHFLHPRAFSRMLQEQHLPIAEVIKSVAARLGHVVSIFAVFLGGVLVCVRHM